MTSFSYMICKYGKHPELLVDISHPSGIIPDSLGFSGDYGIMEFPRLAEVLMRLAKIMHRQVSTG